MKKILFAAFAAAVLAGCYKVDIYWSTHPDTGKITLITDWSKRSPDADIPNPYNIQLLEPSAMWKVSEYRFEVPNLFDPGTYTLHVFNEAENLKLDGSVVSLYQKPLEPTRAKTRGPEEGWPEEEIPHEEYWFYAVPDFFFWGSVTQKIEADRDYEVTVPMRQITRQVEIDFTIEDVDPQLYEEFYVYIIGTNDAWDCEANKPVGYSMNTAIPASPQSGRRITGETRILGVMEDRPIKMMVEFLYDDGDDFYWLTSEEIDVTADFKDFNTSDRTVPLVLKKTISFPPMIK